ncbi:MAG: hypothetical protein M3418_08755 [Gemmatimonadota bacterium]|nr:hypothetical protein [Gemmatimonadota bacterium]
MTEPDLLTISVTAFIAVIVLLALLAGVIRALTAIFPDVAVSPETDAAGPDGALLAAIHAAASLAHSGTRVTRIEEMR